MPAKIARDVAGVSIIREQMRSILALIAIGGFMAIIGGIVLASLLGWISANVQTDGTTQILTTVGGVLGGIVGAVVGFYFRIGE